MLLGWQTMERLIEQPVGEGDIFEGETHLGRAHYHLSVYRHFSDVEDEMVPTHIEVEGRITLSDSTDLAAFHQRQVELSLRLADGRLLDFRVADDQGNIRSTALGLHFARA
jgi:hypothetical protein